MAEYFHVLSVFVLNMASSNSQINKLQRGHLKRVELLDVNINTGAQSINSEKASFRFHRVKGSVMRLGLDNFLAQ